MPDLAFYMQQCAYTQMYTLSGFASERLVELCPVQMISSSLFSAMATQSTCYIASSLLSSLSSLSRSTTTPTVRLYCRCPIVSLFRCLALYAIVQLRQPYFYYSVVSFVFLDHNWFRLSLSRTHFGFCKQYSDERKERKRGGGRDYNDLLCSYILVFISCVFRFSSPAFHIDRL